MSKEASTIRKCPVCKKEMKYEFIDDTFHCEDKECPFPYDVDRKPGCEQLEHDKDDEGFCKYCGSESFEFDYCYNCRDEKDLQISNTERKDELPSWLFEKKCADCDAIEGDHYDGVSGWYRVCPKEKELQISNTKGKHVFPEYKIENDCGMKLCEVRTNGDIGNVVGQLIVIYQCINCGQAFTLTPQYEVKQN